MFLPTVGREVFSGCWPFSSRLGQSSFQAGVGSVSIIVMLEPKEFRLQICCGPEQRAVEELAPNGADQALHERMGQRDIRNRLDLRTSRTRRLACH